MKAVYEMPRVAIEVYAADGSVASSCEVNGSVQFNCLMGETTDDTSVLSSAFNGQTCKNDAGFADWSQFTKDTTEDDINYTLVQYNIPEANGNSGSTSLIQFGGNKTNGTINVTSTNGFLGWLYITSFSGGFNTTGWQITDGQLVFNSVSAQAPSSGSSGVKNVLQHAQIAAVFGSNIGVSR